MSCAQQAGADEHRRGHIELGEQRRNHLEIVEAPVIEGKGAQAVGGLARIEVRGKLR